MMDEKRRAVIECRHVSKTFYALSGDHLVVDDLNFNVYENEPGTFYLCRMGRRRLS